MVEAIGYLHGQGIAHRDLKCKNILLSNDETEDKIEVKIIDFGLSNFSKGNSLHRTFCGTPAYAAPEMILAQSYSGPEVDVWSLGVVLYLMIRGEFPFSSISNIITGTFTPSEALSMPVNDLLAKMFARDFRQRISLQDVKLHPWVTGSSVLYDSSVRVVPCQVLDNPSSASLSEKNSSEMRPDSSSLHGIPVDEIFSDESLDEPLTKKAKN